MRAEVRTFEVDGFDDIPRTVVEISYYDTNGVLLGQVYDDPLACVITDVTMGKLEEIATQFGVQLAAPAKWSIYQSINCTIYFSKEQFWTNHAVKNKEALQLLANAFEALDHLDQKTLMDHYRCAIGAFSEVQIGRVETPASLFSQTMKMLLNKDGGGNSTIFEGVTSSVRQAMTEVLSSLGLEPEGKDKDCLKQWMEVLLKDPSVRAEEENWGDAAEEMNRSNRENMPEAMRGKKIGDSYAELRRRKDEPLHEEWKQYPKFLDGYFERNPSHSPTDGKRACASKFNRSLKTIQRRTKDYKKARTS